MIISYVFISEVEPQIRINTIDNNLIVAYKN